MRLPLAAAPAGADGRAVVYGIRPEHFAIADDGVEAEVVVIEPTGSETQVFAQLGGEEIVAVFRERHQFAPGERIRLQARSAAACICSTTSTGQATRRDDTATEEADHDHVHPPHRSSRRAPRWPAPARSPARGSAEWAQAWAQAAPWKPEKGAKLPLLRWKRFVQAEEDAFMALVAAFTKATGVQVKVINESLDDVQPKASVAANTGQGPDMFWGLYSLPHLFPAKCVDVTDVADYLGKKYGGWVPTRRHLRQERQQVDRDPGRLQRQRHQLPQSMIEKAGFKEFPKTTDGFLAFCKALKAQSAPGGFALGRASGDGNAWVHWCLWAFGGNLVDAKDKVIINSPETVKALEYAKAAVRDLRPRHRVVERCLQQQGVPRQRGLADQQRRVDLRRRQGART